MDIHPSHLHSSSSRPGTPFTECSDVDSSDLDWIEVSSGKDSESGDDISELDVDVDRSGDTRCLPVHNGMQDVHLPAYPSDTISSCSSLLHDADQRIDSETVQGDHDVLTGDSDVSVDAYDDVSVDGRSDITARSDIRVNDALSRSLGGTLDALQSEIRLSYPDPLSVSATSTIRGSRPKFADTASILTVKPSDPSESRLTVTPEASVNAESDHEPVTPPLTPISVEHPFSPTSTATSYEPNGTETRTSSFISSSHDSSNSHLSFSHSFTTDLEIHIYGSSTSSILLWKTANHLLHTLCRSVEGTITQDGWKLVGPTQRLYTISLGDKDFFNVLVTDCSIVSHNLLTRLKTPAVAVLFLPSKLPTNPTYDYYIPIGHQATHKQPCFEDSRKIDIISSLPVYESPVMPLLNVSRPGEILDIPDLLNVDIKLHPRAIRTIFGSHVVWDKYLLHAAPHRRPRQFYIILIASLLLSSIGLSFLTFGSFKRSSNSDDHLSAVNASIRHHQTGTTGQLAVAHQSTSFLSPSTAIIPTPLREMALSVIAGRGASSQESLRTLGASMPASNTCDSLHCTQTPIEALDAAPTPLTIDEGSKGYVRTHTSETSEDPQAKSLSTRLAGALAVVAPHPQTDLSNVFGTLNRFGDAVTSHFASKHKRAQHNSKLLRDRWFRACSKVIPLLLEVQHSDLDHGSGEGTGSSSAHKEGRQAVISRAIERPDLFHNAMAFVL